MGGGATTTSSSRLPQRLTEMGPGLTAALVREALHRAVRGIGPLAAAASVAGRKLAEQEGDVDRAIHELIENHVRYAGAQGFLTNLGGLATMTYLVPANITGLALVQCRMVAGIAHLRGYDLQDPRVRNAVMACLVGEDGVKVLVKRKKLPSSPMAIATAPAYDPDLDHRVASEVASELIARVAGKKTIAFIARRTPVIGGGVGAVTDGLATYEIGRYAAKQLKRRK